MSDWQNPQPCPAGRNECPNDTTLKRLLTGELEASIAATVEPIFAECGECARRCESLRVRDTIASALQNNPATLPSGADVVGMLDRMAGATSSTDLHATAQTEPSAFAETVTGDRQQSEQPTTDPSEQDEAIPLARVIAASRKSGLFDDATLEELERELNPTGDPVAVLKNRIDGDRLTAWQARQLLKGRSRFRLDNDRYLLLDLIGKGGMGAVYRARHLRMNREVAIKVINARGGDAGKLTRRFEREVAITSKLHHEHIVHAYDVGKDGELAFLVLEYVRGGDLSSIVKNEGPMNAEEAAAICVQAASGLAYAHAGGIVHRDIKPQNILLASDGITKILDLGLARIDSPEVDGQTSLTREGAVMGTIDYMAPEQGHDAQQADARSDVYSLGATAYYLLTGHSPLPGGSVMDKLRRLATEAPPPLGRLRPDVPRELTAVVERMMAKDPEARPATMEDVVRALKPFAADTLAGRAVVTASVRTAAETVRAADAGTVGASTPSFPFESDETVGALLRRRSSGNSRQTQWLLAGSAVVALLIGVAIWAFGGSGVEEPDKPAAHDEPVRSQSPPVVLSKQPPQRIRAQRTQHYGGFSQGHSIVAWSRDGRRFSTSTIDGDIRVWQTRTQKLLTVYRGHYEVQRIEWSPDGKTVGSLDSRTGEVHLWDANTGRLQHRIALKQKIYSFAFLPHAKELILTGKFGMGRWSIAQREMHERMMVNPGNNDWRGYYELHFSPDGKWLAASDYNKKEVHLWDLSRPTKRPRNTVELPRFYSGARSYARWSLVDNKRIVVVTDGKLQYRAIPNGTIVKEQSIPKWEKDSRGIWLSRYGRWLLVTNDEGLHQIDLLSGGRTTVKYRGKERYSSRMRGSVISPTGIHFFGYVYSSGESRLGLLTIGSGGFDPFHTQPTLAGRRPILVGGRFLYAPWSGQYDSAGGWDLATGKAITDSLNRFGWNAHVTDTGDWLFFNDKQILQTRPENANAVPRVVSAPEGLADVPKGLRRNRAGFYRQGKRLWVWHRHEKSTDPPKALIREWDTATGKLLKTSKYESKDVTSYDGLVQTVVANPHGNNLAIGRLKNVSNYEIELSRSKLSKPLRFSVAIRQLASQSHFSHFGLRLALSANDRRLAAVNIIPETAIVWDAQSGKRIASVRLPAATEKMYVNDLSCPFQLSSSGRYLLLHDAVWDVDASPPRVVWKVDQVYAWHYFFAALSGDERHIVVRVRDQIQIWDWRANKKRATIFLLPDTQWLCWNHETGHYSYSQLGRIDVRFAAKNNPEPNEWFDYRKYAEKTGWKNDPSKAGLKPGTIGGQ